MNFLILRDGRQYGPYPIGSLQEMLRKNEVVPTDMMWSEGWKEWLTVESYLFSTGRKSSSAAMPPPLPSKVPPPLPEGSSTKPPVIPGKIEAMNELEQRVLEGGRFVVFQYCFSVFIMTFKRSSSVTFLKRDQDGFSGALTHSLISLCVGWWGIPWGPIWTISTVYRNACGGLDVTDTVLLQLVGPARAAQILARRPKPDPAGFGMKCFRVGLIAVPVLIFCILILSPVISGVNEARKGASYRNASSRYTPESRDFRAANNLINTYQGTTAFGNTTQAVAVATSFSRQISVMRDLFFQGGKKSGVSISDHKFLTYCQLSGTNCAIMVHVPELRRFSEDAKKSFGGMAWTAANIALFGEGLTNADMNLGVGFRGIMLYDRVMVGTISQTLTNAQEPSEILVGNNPESRLHPFFEPSPAVVLPSVKKKLAATNALPEK